MKPHPLSEKFPLMRGEKFEALKAHIAAHGQKVPILRFQGQILDGRNRYRALDELAVPRTAWQFKDFEGTEEQAAVLVQALNLERRNLSPDEEREIRAGLVREMHEKGMSQRAIAEVVGVSQPAVNKMLRKQVITELSPEPAENEPAPKVTGKDGKKYPATKPPRAKPVEPEPEEEVEDEDEGEGEPGDEPAPARPTAAARVERQLNGVGVIRANEAINCLIRIPRDDSLRARGLQIVADWVRANK